LYKYYNRGFLLTMKIFEILDSQPDSKKLDFDLVDDLIFYMYNDQTFYRSKFYPVEIKFKRLKKSGQTAPASSFVQLVRDAYSAYYDKYKSAGLEKTLPKDILSQICIKLHSQVIDDLNTEK